MKIICKNVEELITRLHEAFEKSNFTAEMISLTSVNDIPKNLQNFIVFSPEKENQQEIIWGHFAIAVSSLSMLKGIENRAENAKNNRNN